MELLQSGTNPLIVIDQHNTVVMELPQFHA